MKVLSLCDGLACGLMAFKEIGIPVDYYAVEIDKYPRQIADHNFEFDINRPTNDVNLITEEMVLELGPFDVVMFGSPCQSVSMAGKQEGLKGSSGLLLKCLEVLRWAQKYNPDLKFLIENVKMKKEFLLQFNELIGVEPVLINSALVSAQSRARYYWTNFPVTPPRDLGIVVADILEELTDIEENSHVLSDKLVEGFKNKKGSFKGKFKPLSLEDQKNSKSFWLTARYNKLGCTDPYVEVRPKVYKYSESRRYKDENGNSVQYKELAVEKKTETRLLESDKSLTLLTGDGCEAGSKGINLVLTGRPHGFNKGYVKDVNDCKAPAISKSSWEQNNLLKTPTDMANYLSSGKYRKLTVRECARLQTIPDWYEFPVSKTQAYKAIGNGWTISVIAHILNHIWSNEL